MSRYLSWTFLERSVVLEPRDLDRCIALAHDTRYVHPRAGVYVRRKAKRIDSRRDCKLHTDNKITSISHHEFSSSFFFVTTEIVILAENNFDLEFFFFLIKK